jgi:hypothetical protein
VFASAVDRRLHISATKPVLGVTLLVLTLVAAQAQGASHSAQDETQAACGLAAMTDYKKANLALLQEGMPLMSVEGTIAQRRLQEQFCLRIVRCAFTDQGSLQFMAAFDSCLSDEALEKYNAVPRDR